VVDDEGLHLEYAPGYEPEHYYEHSETAWDEEYATTKSFVIDVEDLPNSRFQHIADRWEEVFGKIESADESSVEEGTKIDDQREPTYYPYPIMDMADEHYLDYLREAIDKYNAWNNDTPKCEEQLEEELGDPEETVVAFPDSDGLILPTPRL
jgi:hypothetical protein